MSIKEAAVGDIRAAQKVRIPWWVGLIVATFSFGLFWIFDHFDSLDRALPIMDSAVAFGFVAFVKRKLLRKWWFWMTMGFFAVIHALVIWYSPLHSESGSALIAGAMVSVDICLMLWIFAVIGRLVEKRRPLGAAE